MISKGIIYIFIEEHKGLEYTKDNEQSRPFNQKSNNFKPGDIIQLKFSINSKNDHLCNRHPARRSISTYGLKEIEPEEYTDYVVTCLDECGNIPNHKGRNNIDRSMNNIDTFMYVFPKKEYDEMNGLFEHTKEIFWFINLNKMTVCQFEDAYPLYSIASITVTGHYN
tara:strand:- start:451 stop:951 length:501 start_codon:yes stop_codon:yes gene_type:complete